MNRTPNVFLHAMLAAVLVLQGSGVHADLVVSEPEDGTRGMDGIEGSPGTDGGDGDDGGNANAENSQIDEDEPARTVALGGNGGAGGDGGNGAGEDDVGGTGGDGGHGGSATSLSQGSAPGFAMYVAAQSRGGQGGFGGIGGDGYIDGVGGDRGRGGDATAIVLVRNGGTLDGASDAESDAGGGRGGFAFGTGAQAGDGGNAIASTVFLDLIGTGNTIQRVEADAAGGDGGTGIDGAHAGNGGGADIGAVVATALGDARVFAIADAIGGRGGDATGAGRSGNGASVDLDNVVRVVSPGSIRIVQNATGGDGGDVEDGASGLAGNARTVLNRVASGNSQDAGGSYIVELTAQAGDGGQRTSALGAAADGGDSEARATLEAARFFVDVDSRAYAGSGGDGVGGASGGNGGNATALGDVVGRAANNNNSRSVVNVRASAGSGGAGSGGVDQVGSTGGSAHATATADSTTNEQVSAMTRAIAGRGGDINEFGSGNGGQGGTAFGNAEATSHNSDFAPNDDVSVEAYVVAGGGGDGRGAGFRGADGAVASAYAMGTSLNGATVESEAVIFGGHGGSGLDGADAGSGASVVLENSAAGSTSGTLILEQHAIAGNAGDTVGGGLAGQAGIARINALHDHGGTRLITEDFVSGGDGGSTTDADTGAASRGANAQGSVLTTGSVRAESTLSVIGGDGGDAVGSGAAAGGGNAVVNGASVQAPVSAFLEVRAFGGSGGAATGDVTDVDANGGQVVINGPLIANASGGGSASISLLASGGSAYSGNGANVELVDRVDALVEMDGSVWLTQTAWGGWVSRTNDAGTNTAGNAISHLTRSAASRSIVVRTEAKGGNSSFANERVGSDGGNADVIADSTNTSGDAEAFTLAEGGSGAGGDFLLSGTAGSGGDAISLVRSEATSGRARASGTARAGSGGSSFDALSTASGGKGGDALGEAFAISHGFESAVASQTSEGGTGGNAQEANRAGDGGRGVSLAHAINLDEGSAVADAIARAGRAGNTPTGLQSRGGNASARAIAESMSTASAAATATSDAWRGRLGNADARATAHGMFSQGHAIAETRGEETITRIRADAHVYAGGRADAFALSSSGTIDLTVLAFGSLSASTVAVGLPFDDDVNRVIQGTVNVAQDFDVGGASDMLAFVDVATGYDTDVGDNVTEAFNTIELDIDTNQLQSQQNLLLGLFDTKVADNGFSNLQFSVDVEGQRLVDEVFTDILAAGAFFNDQTLDLGLWSDLVSSDGILNVDIFVWSTDLMDDMGFRFSAVLGNSTVGIASVPLPPALWLLLTGVLAIPRRRRAGP